MTTFQTCAKIKYSSYINYPRMRLLFPSKSKYKDKITFLCQQTEESIHRLESTKDTRTEHDVMDMERLTSLCHTCPKWHAEILPVHSAFTALPFYFFAFILPDQRLHIVKSRCMHIYIHTYTYTLSDCVQTVYELPLHTK